MVRDFHDGDGDDAPKARRFTEFECPMCNAHNPVDEGFKYNDEVFCNYCGATLKAIERNGRLKFKEV
jgi:transcription elongation factor Elf1